MTQDNKGLLWGLLGVTLFAATLPMTKLALGSAALPQLSPWFVTFGRAAVAGLLSVLYLLFMHSRGQLKIPARGPNGGDWGLVAFTAAGVVVGFPLFLALALRFVPSMHGAVVTGLLPLATAVVAAIWLKQRPALGFWICAVLGSVLVLGFMIIRAGGISLGAANIFLLLAMTSAALGYIGGARLTPKLGGSQVICWVLVLSLPLTLPVTLLNLPASWSAIGASSWVGFAYVAVISMWVGFFAWYRGLAMGGAVRVSQVQLVQPFLSLLFAIPLVGEQLDLITGLFGLAVIATVFVGKKMPVGQSAMQGATK
jgi:drug/metabolite transporter (DMT)-like permease